MAFNYQPVSANGVVNAVNGSVAAATNLVNMQHILDESRNARQDKLHAAMLRKQKTESNFSNRMFLTEDLDDNFYERTTGVEGDDDNTRAMAMWDRVNAEHGNNRNMGAFLDKYKNTTDFSGPKYARYKRDMKMALLRSSISAEEDANGYVYHDTVTDPETGKQRREKMFDIAKYYAYKHGNSEPVDEKFVEIMSKSNEKAQEVLRATGENFRKDLDAQVGIADKSGQLAKRGQTYSQASGGSFNSGGGFTSDGSSSFKTSGASQLKEARPDAQQEQTKIGATRDESLIQADKLLTNNLYHQSSPRHREIVENEGGNNVLYGRLFKALPSDTKEKYADDMTQGMSQRDRDLFEGLDDASLGLKMKDYVNQKGKENVTEFRNAIGGVTLPPTDRGSDAGGGGGAKPTTSFSSTKSGLEDKSHRAQLSLVATKMTDLMKNYDALLQGSGLQTSEKEVGSARLRSMREEMMELLNPDIEVDLSDLDFTQEYFDPQLNLISNEN